MNRIVSIAGMMLSILTAQSNIATGSNGDVYLIWDTGQTIMFESVTNGNTIEIQTEEIDELTSSNNYGYTFENNGQVWEDPTKREELKTTGLSGPLDQECKLCNRTQSDSLDMSGRRIRQD